MVWLFWNELPVHWAAEQGVAILKWTSSFRINGLMGIPLFGTVSISKYTMIKEPFKAVCWLNFADVCIELRFCSTHKSCCVWWLEHCKLSDDAVLNVFCGFWYSILVTVHFVGFWSAGSKGTSSSNQRMLYCVGNSLESVTLWTLYVCEEPEKYSKKILKPPCTAIYPQTLLEITQGENIQRVANSVAIYGFLNWIDFGSNNVVPVQ